MNHVWNDYPCYIDPEHLTICWEKKIHGLLQVERLQGESTRTLGLLWMKLLKTQRTLTHSSRAVESMQLLMSNFIKCLQTVHLDASYFKRWAL